MSPEQNKLQPTAKKISRRWLKILLITLAAIFILIALAPTILSTSPFRNLALNQINSSINGQLSIDSWSIGWFTGVELRGVSLQDEGSESLATIESLSLDPSYFSLLGRNPQLGKINLRSLRLDIRFDRQGNTNLEKILPPRAPTTTTPTQPSFDLDITDSSVVIHKPDATALSIHNINASVTMPLAPGPVSFKLDCDLSDAQAKGKIQAQGSILRLADGRFRPELLQATAEATVEQLDLQLLSPLLQRANLDLEIAGLLNLQAHVRLEGLENIQLDCQANSADIKVVGKLLKTDELHLRDFVLNAQANLHDTLLSLDKLRLDSDLILLQTNGTIHLAATDKLPELGSAHLDGKLTADLPKILNQLPNTLHFHPGLKITSGDLTANYTITTTEGNTKLLGSATLQNLQGSTAKRKIQLDEPVEFSFDIVRNKEQVLQIRQLSADSAFASLSATGKANDLTLEAQLDLAKFNTQLAQFIDLGGISLAGQLLCQADITTQDRRLNFQIDLTADELLITGLASRSLKEPHLQLTLDGSLTRTENNKIAALSFKQAQLLTDRIQLQFSGQIDPKPLAITGQAQIKADLARLQELALAFDSFPDDIELQGQLHSSLTFAASRPQTIACEGESTIQNLRIVRKTGQTIHEPNVSLQHKLIYDLDSRTLDGELPQLKLAGLDARFQKLTLTPGPDGKFNINIRADFQGDLRRLNPWLVAFVKLDPKVELAGQLSGQASYSRQAQQEKFTLSSQILNLQLRPPDRPAFAEPKISLQIEGSADRDAQTLELSRLDVSSDFLQVNAQIATGLSSPASPAKITLQAQSDLERLSRVMQPWFNNWPELTGSGSANMTLTGTPPKAGSTDWLASLSGPATLHIDQQLLVGMTLGPADIDMHVEQGLLIIPPSTIPANKGKINFQAKVSLNRTKPFLVISGPINLLEDVQINAQMSNALLKFINPVFADNNQVSGTVSFICNNLLIDDPATWKKTAKMNGLFSGKDLLFQPRKGIMADLASVLDLDLSSKLGELRPVNIELSEGIISYKDMHIVFSKLLDLSFSGKVSLLDETIDMRVGIPILPAMVANRPELQKLLVGQRIYLPITGTLSQPRLDMAAFPTLLLQQISRILANEIPGQIGDLLEDIFKPVAPPPP